MVFKCYPENKGKEKEEEEKKKEKEEKAKESLIYLTSFPYDFSYSSDKNLGKDSKFIGSVLIYPFVFWGLSFWL